MPEDGTSDQEGQAIAMQQAGPAEMRPTNQRQNPSHEDRSQRQQQPQEGF